MIHVTERWVREKVHSKSLTKVPLRLSDGVFVEGMCDPLQRLVP